MPGRLIPQYFLRLANQETIISSSHHHYNRQQVRRAARLELRRRRCQRRRALATHLSGGTETAVAGIRHPVGHFLPFRPATQELPLPCTLYSFSRRS